jgi:transposase
MLLMVTLSKPLWYGRFIYAPEVEDDNILQFAFYHQIPLQLYTDTNEKAALIIDQYNEIKEKMNPRAIAARRKRKLAAARKMEALEQLDTLEDNTEETEELDEEIIQ